MRAEERKRKLRRELRRLYRTLQNRDLDVVVNWEPKRCEPYGDYDPDGGAVGGMIRINPWKFFVETFIHELFHHLEPRASHRRIYALEQFIVRNASPRQLMRLFGYGIVHSLATLSDRPGKMPRCQLCGHQLRRLPLLKGSAACPARPSSQRARMARRAAVQTATRRQVA